SRSERQGVADMYVFGGPRNELFLGSRRVNRDTGEVATDMQTRGGVLNQTHPGGCMDDFLAYGNSISRTGEDRGGVLVSDRRVKGRCIAFDEELSVAYMMGWGAESWEGNTNRKVPVPLNLSAASDEQQPLWTSPDMEFVV